MQSALTSGVARRSPDAPREVAPPRGRVILVLAAVTGTATVVCVVALLAAGGRPPEVPPGLPDPGALTGWGLRLVRLLGDLAAVLTIGSLLVAAVLVRDMDARLGGLGPVARRAMRAAGGWAAVWATLTASAAVLAASHTLGVPIRDLDLDQLGAVGATAQVQALLAATSGAAVVAGAARSTLSVTGCRWLLLVALASLLPPVLAGHASTSVDSDVASSAMVVHVVAATLWTGGLAGLLLHLRGAPSVLPAALDRFSSLALVCYIVLGLSGLLGAWVRMPSAPDWGSGYGAIVVAKIGTLLLLGVVGHVHRRRSLPALAGGRSRTFLRLAVVELVMMGAATGLAAALAHTPAPIPAPTTPAAVVHGSGHSSLPSVVDPFTLGELATAWRPQAIVLVAVGLALAAYVRGLRRLAARGRSWPARRTVAFTAGLMVALVDLCSGVATYAAAMISVQIVQLLVMLLLVPSLLTLGAPLTLWLEANDARAGDRSTAAWSRATRAVLTPVMGAALATGLLMLVYRTPLIELSVRSSWVHLLVLGLALTSGLALMWPTLQADHVPDPKSFTERASCVLVLVACLALLAAQLRDGSGLLAGEWFLELRWSWVDPMADQRRAGTIVAGMAVATTLMVVGASLSRRRATP